MSPPEPAAPVPSAVDSLARSAPRFLVYCGLLVFLLNIAVAWTVVIRSNAAINAPLMSADGPKPSAAASALKAYFTATTVATPPPSGATTDALSSDRLVLLDRLIKADFYQRLIGNNQTLQIAGMALAFSFLALGFSLYVLGIRGAFSLSVGQSDPNSSARLAFAASTPGLLCFLLAAVITCIALTRDFDVSLGDVEVGRPAPTPAKTPEAPPDPADLFDGEADREEFIRALAAEAAEDSAKPSAK